jgi:hypothetical protein
MGYENIIVGVLSSIAASFLFLFLMFMMRPRLAISELIARTNFNGEKAFIVKIINQSWWKLYDIHAEFAHIKFRNATGGQNIYYTRLRLLSDHVWSLNNLHGWNDNNAEYAILFVCLDDLDTLWTNDTMIEFRVMAKHSFSGFNRILRRRFYRSQSSIRDGSFKFGNSLEID